MAIRPRNKSVIPSGLLAPAGETETYVNPAVQSTVRPPGTLLMPSPGYHSIRVGKNVFQRGVPTGGFRKQEFAEDVGGTGAVLAVVPGETAEIAASEWLPTGEGEYVPEGTVLISDRKLDPGYASYGGEAYNTIPDMGDRTPERPLSRATWLRHPFSFVTSEYHVHPLATIVGSIALVYLGGVVVSDLERSYRSNRGRGPASAVTAAPAAGAQTAGDVSAGAVDKVGKAADDAVERIGKATDDAVEAIESAGKKVTE